MKVAELVLKYIQTLAWPVVLTAVIWALRAQLRAAVARVTRVETPAGSIDFAAEARDVLREAESAAGVGGLPAGTTRQQESEGEPSAPRDAPPESLPSTPEVQEWDPIVGRRVSELRRARDLADSSPSTAVLRAWDAFSQVCRFVLAVTSDSSRHKGPTLEWFNWSTTTELVELGLPLDSARVIERLYELRKQALYDGAAVTPIAARDFADSCLALGSEVMGLSWQ